jgi:hypothetical protein
MSTVAIREKLHRYIETAHDKKVKAIYAMVEDEMTEDALVWTDKFLIELNKRASDFESGKVKGRSWEEVKKGARQRVKSR